MVCLGFGPGPHDGRHSQNYRAMAAVYFYSTAPRVKINLLIKLENYNIIASQPVWLKVSNQKVSAPKVVKMNKASKDESLNVKKSQKTVKKNNVRPKNGKINFFVAYCLPSIQSLNV